MVFLKARYLKDGQQQGREYTFSSDVIVKPGDVVSYGKAVLAVTAVDVPEEEFALYKNNIKKIDGKIEEE